MGADLIISTMKKLEAGTAERIPQDDSKSNYAKMLSKDMGIIDFSKSAEEIERQIRALNPWPMSFTKIAGKTAKIYQAEVITDVSESSSPGEITEVTKKSFTIACGEGALRIKRLQPEGKKEMDAASYLNGNKLEVGMICGS
jgi:methionyl-tRNA formyltransferase